MLTFVLKNITRRGSIICQSPLCTRSAFLKPAEVAQLVEHNLAKVGVASSSLVFCSKKKRSSATDDLFFFVFNYSMIPISFARVVLSSASGVSPA